MDHDRSQLGTSLQNVGTSLRNNGDALRELSSPDPQKLIRSSSEQPTVTILNKGKMGDVQIGSGNKIENAADQMGNSKDDLAPAQKLDGRNSQKKISPVILGIFSTIFQIIYELLHRLPK